MTTAVLGPKAPADELSLARLRRVLADTFGDVPDMAHHLALLDSRGVLDATHAATTWRGIARPQPRRNPTFSAVAHLDEVLRGWPRQAHPFITAYGRVEHAVENGPITLPPLTD